MEKKDQVIDAGGAYRDIMSSINDELIDTKEGRKVKCLKMSPGIPQGAQETFMLNDKATQDADRDLFVCLGGFLAFSFLTG